MPRIKKVTYSKPVTIIRWDDDTITKSFCDEVDNYDELTGFLMCVIKKMVPAKEMRKLFSKYVYGDDPKYIKRIVPKKDRKKVDQYKIPWCYVTPACTNIEGEGAKEITLEIDPKWYANNPTTTDIDMAVDSFTEAINELAKLFNDED